MKPDTLVVFGATLLAAVALCGCEDSDGTRAPDKPETLPESISVPAAQIEVGTANGTIRKTASVGGFSITRFPISVREYRDCVRARACSAPARSFGGCASDGLGAAGRTYTTDAGERDELPVTCTEPAQAAAFCKWVGGRLPSIEEWMHAARGPSVQPYSWGGAAATCERHHVALARLGKEQCCPADGCKISDLFAVGHHAAGKSPLGLEDVLLTPGELVGYGRDAAMPGCRASATGCIVATLSGASIDSVLPAPDAENKSAATPVWSFRCAWHE